MKMKKAEKGDSHFKTGSKINNRIRIMHEKLSPILPAMQEFLADLSDIDQKNVAAWNGQILLHPEQK